MNKSVFRILICLAGASALRGAPPSVNDLLRKAESDIQAASHHGDSGRLERAELTLDKALLLDAKNPWVWYYKGFAANTRASLAVAAKNEAEEAKALKEADEDLEKSLGLERTGEALALRSSVVGMQIQIGGPDAGAQLGPIVGQYLGQARAIAPQSPQVLFAAGVSSLFTPKEFGGDIHEAKKLLEAAEAALAAPPPAPRPTWGQADVHVWLGLTNQKLGDNAGAKAEFDKALAIDPDYRWVKYVLKPQLDHPAEK